MPYILRLTREEGKGSYRASTTTICLVLASDLLEDLRAQFKSALPRPRHSPAHLPGKRAAAFERTNFGTPLGVELADENSLLLTTHPSHGREYVMYL